MTHDDPSVLSALASPHSAREFLDRYWPDEIFVAHGDPARLPALFTSAELSSFESLASRYRGNLRFTQGRKCQQMIAIDRVDPALLFEMGLTLQFENIVPLVPGAAEFLRRLERELGVNEGSASMSAFASPASDGLSCHYDAQDLISIQLIGSKQFHVAPVSEIKNPFGTQYVTGTEPYNELYPQAAGGFPDAATAEFKTVEMKPGTVLFLPRGTWHYTEAGGPSLSISIIINPPTAADCLLELLRYQLLQDEHWRRPLYGATGDAAAYRAAETVAQRLLKRLPDATARLNTKDFLDIMRSFPARLFAINPQSRFQKQPHAQVYFSASTGEVDGPRTLEVKLYTPGSGMRSSVRMEISPEAAAIFEWLNRQQRPFRVAELQTAFPKFPFEELRNILIAAAQARLLRLLWFAPADESDEPRNRTETARLKSPRVKSRGETSPSH